MAAEILRDREETGQGDDASRSGAAPQPNGFADLAAQLAAKRGEIEATRKERATSVTNEAAAMERGQAARAPAIADARQALAQPRPQPIAPLQSPPPPSPRLHDFLAPVAGESPENTITKLIQGIGLMAAGFTGLRRGNATAALASLQGALKGWHEGDAERGDREFRKWQADSRTMIADWESRHRVYRDIVENMDADIGQKMKALELSGIEAGHETAVATFKRQSIDDTLKWLSADERALQHMQEQATRLREMHAEKESNRAFLEKFWRMKADEKKAAAATTSQSIIPQDEELEVLGKQWFTDERFKFPVSTRGDKGELFRKAIIARGIKWAKDNGLDPLSSAQVRTEVAAHRGAALKLQRDLATQNASIRRFDAHLDLLVEAARRVPRSEVPAMNAAILRGERDYKGSPEAAAAVFQALESSMEYARVIVPGGAQGDEKTREEARKAFALSMTQAQIERVAEQARANAKMAIEKNKESIQVELRAVGNAGAPEQGPPMPPPPGGGSPNDPLGILGRKDAGQAKQN